MADGRWSFRLLPDEASSAVPLTLFVLVISLLLGVSALQLGNREIALGIAGFLAFLWVDVAKAWRARWRGR